MNSAFSSQRGSIVLDKGAAELGSSDLELTEYFVILITRLIK